jgi:hypothetical protein
MEKITLKEALEWVGGYSKPERFADIRRHLDPAWIEEALEATGTATLRKRRLPAEQVVWLVIGMAMYRDRPIYELVDRRNGAPSGSGRVGKADAVTRRHRRLRESSAGGGERERGAA